MASTFLGIEIGKRSLMAHQKGLSVIGHNISNADNKTYSRQRAILSAVDPLYEPALNRAEVAGQIGQGVQVSEIRRERDKYLDIRINAETANKEFWKTNQNNLHQIEDVHHALEEQNLQEDMDRFWVSWQELSKNPSEPAVRQELVQRSVALSRQFNTQFNRFNELRHELNEKIRSDVSRINQIAKSVADINTKILQSQALGDNPNDLLDKRDHLIHEVSKMINVKISFNDDNEIMIFTAGKMLVQGPETKQLKLEENPENEAHFDIYWEESNDRFAPQSGALKANLIARDEHLKNQIKRLDTLAANLIVAVNEIHQRGFNAYDARGGVFFQENPLSSDIQGNYDLNQDGVFDSTLIFQVVGSAKIEGSAPIGSGGIIRLRKEGEIIEVPYQADDRISEVIERVNHSQSEISFHLNHNKQLVVKGNSNGPQPFSIDYLEDTGNLLTGISGVLIAPNTAFQYDVLNSVASSLAEGADFKTMPMYHPSSWINLREDIQKDPQLVASAHGTDYDGIGGAEISNGSGDGRVALDISNLRQVNFMLDNQKTFNEFYVSMIDDVGSKGAVADLEVSKYESIVSNLQTLQQSVSGVNIDEEMANMVAMQYGYRASAKLISAIDEMLDTLINRMS